jgi:hypothetical protein
MAQIRQICQMEKIGVWDGKAFPTTKIGVERIFLFTATQAPYPSKETEMFPPWTDDQWDTARRRQVNNTKSIYKLKRSV